jgi:hypothetical protein
MNEDKELDGLNYENIALNSNAHKLVGKVTKLQSGMTNDVDIDEGSVWLVAGLGHLVDKAPDKLIQQSLDNTIIVNKQELIEFIKNLKNG